MTAEHQAGSELPFQLKVALENGAKLEEMEGAGPEPGKEVERGFHVTQATRPRGFWERTSLDGIGQEPGQGKQPCWESKSEWAEHPESGGNSQPPRPRPRDDRKGAQAPHRGAADPSQQPQEVRVPPKPCMELQATGNGVLARVKEELLEEETLSAEAPQRLFRQACYRDTGGPREACRSLQELCRRWLEPESNTKERMLELVVLEQFVAILPPEMQRWVTASSPGTCSQAVVLAEDFLRRQRGTEWQGEQVRLLGVGGGAELQLPKGPCGHQLEPVISGRDSNSGPEL